MARAQAEFDLDPFIGGGRAFNPVSQSREIRSGVSTSVVEEFSESRSDRVVSTNIAQTMRSRDIVITAENFKPNAPYFVFFDGIDVSAHITPSSDRYGVAGGTSKGTALRSDNQGKIVATFTIPNDEELNFSTGEKTLKVTDSSSNDLDSLSQGSAQYSANGELQVVQEEIVSTRNGRVIQSDVSDFRFQSNFQPVTWVDPLAQSFLVDKPGGIFVTSVEIYVGAKDDNLPITVQIRHMQNGSPTQKILPFAEKTLDPSEVTTTSDGSSSTKFTFPSPVFLESGSEYCVVVMSNSNVYTCWVSEMGKQDIATNDFIDQQPYAGVLFKSQNNSTWTPDQLKDLKLKINRAKFTTSTAANVRFDNSSTGSETLSPNPIEVISGGKTFRVRHYSHGMYDDANQNITIGGVTGDRLNSVFSFSDDIITASGSVTADTQTLSQSSTSGSGTGLTAQIATSTSASTAIVIKNPGQGYAVNDTVTFEKDSETLTFTVAAVADTLGGTPVQYISDTFDVTEMGSGGYKADIDEYFITIPTSVWPARTSSGGASTSNIQASFEDAIGGGSSVTASYNAYFDTIQTAVPSIQLPNTTISSSFLAVGATQPNQANQGFTLDTVSNNLVHNDNVFLQSPKLVLSSINETNELSGGKSFRLTSQLSSTADNVSPVLDVDTMGAILIQNRINSITTADTETIATRHSNNTSNVSQAARESIISTSARGDNNAAVYCTKQVQLRNPANAIHILFDGYRPASGSTDPEIDVYFKILSSESNVQFEDLGWIEASDTDQMPFGKPAADSSDFHEYEYNVEGLDEFVSFAIKIVLRSVDSANVPLVENFRAIALSN